MTRLEQWIFTHYGAETYTPGLERISRALKILKPSLNKLNIVTIAGTNGKGETTHRLRQYLGTSSYCAWTSPHIVRLTERFTSNEGEIREAELEAIVQKCHEQVKSHGFQLTYYEFLFFCFCTWSQEVKAQTLLLEVGLGGRLDAVNALDAQLVLLTSISRDHQEFLGRRYEQILNEKLGVIRREAKLISFLDLNYLRERTQKISEASGVMHLDLQQLSALPAWAFSERNQLLAYAAFCHLTHTPFEPQNFIPKGDFLSDRGEKIKNQNSWQFYGSHNVDGMRKLIQFLHSANYNFKDREFDFVVASFSKRDEKDLRAMLKMLKQGRMGKVLLTSFPHPKAYPSKSLEALVRQEGLDFVEDIEGHVQGWNNQKILVVGSYYFLGHIKSLFR
jgi:dihydrofolate synthase / folylpolyglutamate synthase